ncbi:MAG TPA: long-chain-fatty-acid--CoA ligase [Casimicrobiaceae bacterium]|nr:long-chain-fatty-acid--CoA ligase [Casimicrobiaceae bacterium]
MERPWLAHYPAGVPATIDVGEYASVCDVVDESCRRFSSRPAFTCMGRTLTFADIHALSATFAAWLQGIGVARGTRVALMMPNVLQYPICAFGALRAGCVVVNVNPLYTPRELEHQLVDSGAEVVVVVENFAHTLEQVIARTKIRRTIVTSIGELLAFKGRIIDLVLRRVKRAVPPWSLPAAIRFADAMKEGRKRNFTPVRLGHDDLAFLQYTGGTTGVAKGAMLLHRNVVANLLQARAWMRPFMDENVRQVIVTPLPLYHIFSLTANLLVFMSIGGENVLIVNPRDVPSLVKTMRNCGFTAMTGVNTLFNALLNNPRFCTLDFHAFKHALGGGMAVQEAVANRWRQVTGVPLIEAYGLTETSPAATMNPLDLPRYNGSIGLPISSTDVALRDDDGNDVKPGEPGEICIRGPQVMAGYWQRPEETAKAMTRDGFFKTGDIGTMDERGYVRIVDRKKDMILVSGFNVYPNEVEAVVAMHEGVLECAVIGVPDAKSGEAVKLFVVPRHARLTAEELMAYCHDHLAAYKCPREVIFRRQLPKSNVGKILRRKLREEANARPRKREKARA